MEEKIEYKRYKVSEILKHISSLLIMILVFASFAFIQILPVKASVAEARTFIFYVKGYYYTISS